MRTGHFALLCAAALIAGCGGSNSKDAAKPGTAPSEKLRRELDAATKTSPKAFPAAEGRTLQEVADDLGASGPQVGLASSVFVPGRNRLAFGVIDRQTGFVSGPTAVYVARGPDHPARGPFPAPADLLITQPAFRSQTAASESDPFAAVYSAQVRLDRPGKWAVLSVTQVNGQLVGAGTQVSVVSKRKDSIPQPGDPAPRVNTDTLAWRAATRPRSTLGARSTACTRLISPMSSGASPSRCCSPRRSYADRGCVAL